MGKANFGYSFEMLYLLPCFSLFLLNELTLFVCVLRWSCNLLHGSRCGCRWACGCLAMEWGSTMVVLVVLFIEFYKLFLYWLYKHFIVVILERHNFILVWHVEIIALNFPHFWKEVINKWGYLYIIFIFILNK